jgi:hypothetical protein
LERQRQEAEGFGATDDTAAVQAILDGLQTRVRKLGFGSVTEAVEYLEGLQHGER